MRIIIRGAAEIEIIVTEVDYSTVRTPNVTKQPSAPAGEYVPVNPDPPSRCQRGQGARSGTNSETPVLAVPGGGDTGTAGNEARLAPVAANKSCGDGHAPVSADTQPRAPGSDGRAAPPISTGEGAGSQAGPHDVCLPVEGQSVGLQDNPPDICATLTFVGDQVRAAVANPPPPVKPPLELALKRPVDDIDLQIPAFLRRAT